MAFDVALASLSFLLFVVAWPTFHLTHFAHPALWPVLAAAGTFPLAAARLAPVSAWLATLGAGVVIALLPSADWFEFAWPVAQFLAMLVTFAVVLFSADRRHTWWIAATAIALPLLNPSAASRIGWLIGLAVYVGFVLMVRRLSDSRRALAAQTARAERQSGLRTVAEEKARLARDLHDVVAHQMSMVVVQAQSAPYRLQGVTPALHAEFDSIADTARQALEEVRGLLGVLRGDGEEGAVAPVGALELVPTLTAARASGVDVAWTVEGDLGALDETAGVVLHRVLQESLANASRHAAGAAVQVTIDCASDDGTLLEVTNGPAVAGHLPAPESTGGSGLAGMAARVSAVGGSLTAAPESDGGFTLVALVPPRGGPRSPARSGGRRR